MCTRYLVINVGKPVVEGKSAPSICNLTYLTCDTCRLKVPEVPRKFCSYNISTTPFGLTQAFQLYDISLCIYSLRSVSTMAASDESNYSSNEDGKPDFAAKAHGRLLQVRFATF